MNQPALQFTETHREKALRWIEDNPHGYALFVRFALEKARRGQAFGVKALAERVRWECAVPLEKSDGFRLNNSLVSHIGRKLVEDYPVLRGLVEFRKIHG